MSTSHPSPVAQAFDVIHAEMRRLRAENTELRMRLNQKDAALAIMGDRNKDLERHVTQMRGHIARKFGADAVVIATIERAVAR